MDHLKKGKEDQDQKAIPEILSIQDLINHVTGKTLFESENSPAALPVNKTVFPFSNLIGLSEIKLGLIFSIISPHINSILIVGPPKSGKSLAVHSLVNLLPAREESLCIHGCLPRHIEEEGINAVCPDCAKKFGEGLPISTNKEFRIINLPSNISFEELTGQTTSGSNNDENQVFENGLFLLADQNILYSENIQYLDPKTLKIILNTAQTKSFLIRHHKNQINLQTDFTFIGELSQPEIVKDIPYLNSFDLMITSGFTENLLERKKIRQNVKRFFSDKKSDVFLSVSNETRDFMDEIFAASEFLDKVELPKHLEKAINLLLSLLEINSLNAEHILIEASKASAAADNRLQVNVSDIKNCSLMTLRHHLLQSNAAEQNILEIDNKIKQTLFLIFPE